MFGLLRPQHQTRVADSAPRWNSCRRPTLVTSRIQYSAIVDHCSTHVCDRIRFLVQGWVGSQKHRRNVPSSCRSGFTEGTEQAGSQLLLQMTVMRIVQALRILQNRKLAESEPDPDLRPRGAQPEGQGVSNGILVASNRSHSSLHHSSCRRCSHPHHEEHSLLNICSACLGNMRLAFTLAHSQLQTNCWDCFFNPGCLQIRAPCAAAAAAAAV